MPSSFDKRGSLANGIKLGWATIVLGYILAAMRGGLLAVFPFFERSRVVFALPIAPAATLLLRSACYGLVAPE